VFVGLALISCEVSSLVMTPVASDIGYLYLLKLQSFELALISCGVNKDIKQLVKSISS
jgi:hypothetical protein